jgi:hypothetical protein
MRDLLIVKYFILLWIYTLPEGGQVLQVQSSGIPSYCCRI